MSKIKLLTVGVILLVLLNMAVLSFLFLSKERVPFGGKRMPREIVIEKLHFDDQQIVEYDKFIKIHHEKISDLDDSIQIAKNQLYEMLNTDKIDEVKKERLFLKLGNYQKQIESTHFNHFLEIKSICKKSQLGDYKNLTAELSQIFSRSKKKKNE